MKNFRGVALQFAVRVGLLAPPLVLAVLSLFPMIGCSTSSSRQMIGKDATLTYSRIYLADFETTWQAVLEALKRNRLDITNREGGFIQTRWTDNTGEKNLADSFDATDAYLRAQYRFKITAAKGFYNDRPSVKVSVTREQVVQKDVLDGFRPVASDSIEEQTVLYRIGRVIAMRTKQAHLDEQRTQQHIQSGGLAAPSPDAGRSGDPTNNLLDELDH